MTPVGQARRRDRPPAAGPPRRRLCRAVGAREGGCQDRRRASRDAALFRLASWVGLWPGRCAGGVPLFRRHRSRSPRACVGARTVGGGCGAKCTGHALNPVGRPLQMSWSLRSRTQQTSASSTAMTARGRKPVPGREFRIASPVVDTHQLLAGSCSTAATTSGAYSDDPLRSSRKRFMSFAATTSSLSAPAERSVKLLQNFADAFRVAPFGNAQSTWTKDEVEGEGTRQRRPLDAADCLALILRSGCVRCNIRPDGHKSETPWLTYEPSASRAPSFSN